MVLRSMPNFSPEKLIEYNEKENSIVSHCNIFVNPSLLVSEISVINRVSCDFLF